MSAFGNMGVNPLLQLLMQQQEQQEQQEPLGSLAGLRGMRTRPDKPSLGELAQMKFAPSRGNLGQALSRAQPAPPLDVEREVAQQRRDRGTAPTWEQKQRMLGSGGDTGPQQSALAEHIGRSLEDSQARGAELHGNVYGESTVEHTPSGLTRVHGPGRGFGEYAGMSKEEVRIAQAQKGNKIRSKLAERQERAFAEHEAKQRRPDTSLGDSLMAGNRTMKDALRAGYSKKDAYTMGLNTQKMVQAASDRKQAEKERKAVYDRQEKQDKFDRETATATATARAIEAAKTAEHRGNLLEQNQGQFTEGQEFEKQQNKENREWTDARDKTKYEGDVDGTVDALVSSGVFTPKEGEDYGTRRKGLSNGEDPETLPPLPGTGDDGHISEIPPGAPKAVINDTIEELVSVGLEFDGHRTTMPSKSSLDERVSALRKRGVTRRMLKQYAETLEVGVMSKIQDFMFNPETGKESGLPTIGDFFGKSLETQRDNSRRFGLKSQAKRLLEAWND